MMILARDMNMNTRALPQQKDEDLVLGEDPGAPRRADEGGAAARRGGLSLRRSPLTRKIVIFNLVALDILLIGILYLNSARTSFVDLTIEDLRARAVLTADLVAARWELDEPQAHVIGDGRAARDALEGLPLHVGTEVFLFDSAGNLVAAKTGDRPRATSPMPATPVTDLIARGWALVSHPFAPAPAGDPGLALVDRLSALARASPGAGEQVRIDRGADGRIVAASAPVTRPGIPAAVVVLADTSGELARIAAGEREHLLQMFLIATLVSVGLSLVLASTLLNPLADLVAAAETGRDHTRGNGADGRIRIPDFTARPDEIGRLSAALRGLVGALYSRIESNERFAADVSHEIKNPLASLRSAVDALRVARTGDQRERLLKVIEHDVLRLDRLVSDISLASRLDSELVRGAQERFDLLTLLRRITRHMGADAASRGIEFITDFPAEAIVMTGLEARLAQVFVNLIDNAISFCEEGDAIRVWARRRANRVLVVVEDTGPGIPPGALEKVFERFYSQRPEKDFGNNSGLGLAISKQIVEAHEGVIWAENIRPTPADATSEPLGARFVVGLPI